jgi:hypothetical protein
MVRFDFWFCLFFRDGMSFAGSMVHRLRSLNVKTPSPVWKITGMRPPPLGSG